jgi:hypothetical protein
MTETDKKAQEAPVLKDGRDFNEYADELAKKAVDVLNEETDEDEDD